MSFSKLNELEKQCKEILNDYDLYKNTSRKTLLTLILKDKVMIVNGYVHCRPCVTDTILCRTK